MEKRNDYIRCGALLLGLLLLSWSVAAQAADYVHGHVLIETQPGEDIGSLSDDYQTTPYAQVSSRNVYALNTPEGTDEPTFVHELQADPRVRFAEVDSYMTLAEVNGHHFHFAFDSGPQPGTYVNQQAYAQVHWSGTMEAAGVTVAVLDTGADLSHPALKGCFVPGYNALDPGAEPLDTPDTFLHPALGHGTMIAGLIAKLAPGVRLMPVRVLDSDGQGTLLTVLAGLDFAVANGAQVINMSFGETQYSRALSEALSAAADSGVILVASAGNNGLAELNYPAADPNVLAVASVEASNLKSPYSDYGTHIAVVAPGSGIRSTYWDGGYADWSGTSFAAPLVAAEAALVLAAQPAMEADQVGERIRETAHSVNRSNQAYTGLLGDGLIDISAALQISAAHETDTVRHRSHDD